LRDGLFKKDDFIAALYDIIPSRRELMESYQEEFAFLFAQTGPLNGQRWSIRNELLIGRDSSCDIIISDRQVSRHHVHIIPTAKGIQIEDLGSKNGTELNGELVLEPRFLQDGDIIDVALAQKFVFFSSDATIPLENTVQGILPIEDTPGWLKLDKRSRKVWIQDKEILPPLSYFQFQLLVQLYESEGKVVSRQDLISNIWNSEDAVNISEQALDALVRRLRDRLADADPRHVYIITVRGHGLRLDNPSHTR
jgi:DNA-binding winged helix-turn-helix (wHTH) protein